jgi:VanZ family protein
LRALAPLALMGVIFFLSAQSDLDSGLGTWDTVLRKLAHFGVYGALTLLWVWALRPATARALPAAAAIALLYAAGDEYHQSFVTGRTGSPVDVAIDGLGVAAALLLLHYRPRALMRFLTPLLRRTREGAEM